MSDSWESEVRGGTITVGGGRSTVEELLGLLRGPAWRADALCREYPKVAWFAKSDRTSKAAKAVCARCLVRDECLSYALTDPSLDGIWGGLTTRERTQLRQDGPGSFDRLTA
ncbi:MAG: WhiB family transcriptional regulator [Actinobacteria bacterium]|nr:WhiB family transcriptional regulator [Actinomycetota bacterium]